MYQPSINRLWKIPITAQPNPAIILMAILGFALLMPLPAWAAGPGGVETNLQLWLKADAGISETDGQTITNWTDQSLNGYTASNTAGDGQTAPTFHNNATDNINFNSVVEFDGAANGLDLAGNYIYSSNDGLTFFAVVKPDVEPDKTNFIFDFGALSNKGYGFSYANDALQIYTPTNHGGKTTTSSAITHSYSTNPVVYTGKIDFGNEQRVYINGSSVYNDSITLTQLTSSEVNANATHPSNCDASNISGPVTIGRQSKNICGLDRLFDGKIAEVIVYDTDLVDADRNQVQSYLALKYGITLDSTIDYLTSDSTIIYPSTGNHSGYINDIAGIGVDTGSGLTQLQSRSVNDDSVVTITGSGMTNGNFLVWGNDDGALTFTSIDTPNGSKRFPRVWKVAETGETGNTTLSFDLTSVTGADLTNATKYSLLIDADGNFSDATITTGGTFNGNAIEFSGVNLTNGQYFSLAYENIAPIAGFGTALDFDGVDDYISATSTFSTPPTNLTLEAWIKPDTFTSINDIICYGDSGNSDNAIEFRVLNSTAKLGYTQATPSDIQSVTTTTPLTAGTWAHVAMVKTGANFSLYINGSLDISGTITPSPTSLNQIYFGIRRFSGSNDFFFDGKIDEIRVWNVARTQAEIQANMNTALIGTETGLVGYWSFEDGSGSSIATDLTTNGNDGTLTNMDSATDWVIRENPLNLKFETNQNTPISDTLPGADPDGDTFTYIIVDDDSGAAVITDANTGAFTYTPHTAGTRTFTYKVNDGIADSNIATVTIEVIPNNPPIAGFDTALTFDGVDDYVEVPSGINIANSSFTLEAWAKRDGSGNTDNIIGMGNQTPNDAGMDFSFGTGNDFLFTFVGDSFSVNSTFVDNNWHHWVGVFEQGVGRKVYRDGILVGEVADTGNYIGSDNLWIGNGIWAGSEFSGKIDEVRIWNTARTQAEIQADMDNTLTGSEPNLVGYWQFEDNTGTTTVDSSPNGNTGTLTNGINWPFLTNEDTPLNGSLADFVNFDADGDAFTYIIVDDDSGAAVITDANTGAFTYTPALDVNGIRSFTYKINDGIDDSNISTITIEILPVNDAPVFTSTEVTTASVGALYTYNLKMAIKI